MADNQWYVAYTKPQQETRVEAALFREGREVYLPRKIRFAYRRKRGRRDRVKVERPLFPRYMFVHGVERACDRDDPRLEFVLLDNGNGEPQSVPDELVTMLRDRENIGEFDETATATIGAKVSIIPRWAKPGAAARIVEGPFRDLSGIIERHLPGQIVSLAMQILNCGTPVKVPLDMLAPAQ
jgi:transcription antitermination factor NusG